MRSAADDASVRRHGVLVFAEHRDYLPALRAALLERLPPEDVEAPPREVFRDVPSDAVCRRSSPTNRLLEHLRVLREPNQ